MSVTTPLDSARDPGLDGEGEGEAMMPLRYFPAAAPRRP
jgi:hypothetical protein